MERNPYEVDPNEPRDDVTPGGAPETDQPVQPSEPEPDEGNADGT